MRVLSGLRSLRAEAKVGLGIVVLVLLLGLLVPALSSYSPLSRAGAPLLPPSGDHFFGTDNLGRDVFVRTFSAARLDMQLALIGVTLPLIFGTLIGGMLGITDNRFVKALATAIIEGINAFPFLVLVIAIVAIAGPGVGGVVIALLLTSWARYARISRARTLTIRNAEFIDAARVVGYSQPRVLLRHVLPNVYSETVAYALSDFVLVIVTVSGLSFLGLGVRPPRPEWGGMISDGRLFFQRAWWISICPGIVLSLTAIGVTLISQGVLSRLSDET